MVGKWCLVLGEEHLGFCHHPVRITRQRRGIRRTWNAPSDRGIFRLSLPNGNRCSHTHETIKLGRDIFVHAQATSRSGIRLHPSGMESVCCLELTPIRHGSSGELPARRLVFQVALSNGFSFIGIAMSVGSIVVIFDVDPEISLRGGSCRSSNCDGHHQERLVALHHVGSLVLNRHLHPHIRAISGKGGRKVKSFISGDTRTC